MNPLVLAISAAVAPYSGTLISMSIPNIYIAMIIKDEDPIYLYIKLNNNKDKHTRLRTKKLDCLKLT